MKYEDVVTSNVLAQLVDIIHQEYPEVSEQTIVRHLNSTLHCLKYGLSLQTELAMTGAMREECTVLYQVGLTPITETREVRTDYSYLIKKLK